GELMVNLRKSVLCKCGSTYVFELSTDLIVDDVTISGRCPSCGSSLQITVSALLGKEGEGGIEQAAEKAQSSAERENIETAISDLFG
ncbi:unnamed protein product, partial [marine sediment metagenome]